MLFRPSGPFRDYTTLRFRRVRGAGTADATAHGVLTDCSVGSAGAAPLRPGVPVPEEIRRAGSLACLKEEEPFRRLDQRVQVRRGVLHIRRRSPARRRQGAVVEPGLTDSCEELCRFHLRLRVERQPANFFFSFCQHPRRTAGHQALMV